MSPDASTPGAPTRGRRAAPLPTSGVPLPAYRLSDGERDEAISALAEAYAEGRLDAAEFDVRMAAATEARFATDLDPLFSDLPRRPRARPTPAATRPSPHPPTRPGPARGPWLLGPWLLILVLAIATRGWILLPILLLLANRQHHARSAHSQPPWRGMNGPCSRRS